jgi:DNA-binding Xre family transcriptional regulator
MKTSRIIGQNIALTMEEKKVGVHSLCQKLEISEADLHRVQEGVLMLDSSTLKRMCAELGVSLETMMEQRPESEYRKLIHCMGKYQNPENKEKILDYIDLYIAMEEAMA